MSWSIKSTIIFWNFLPLHPCENFVNTSDMTDHYIDSNKFRQYMTSYVQSSNEHGATIQLFTKFHHICWPALRFKQTSSTSATSARASLTSYTVPTYPSCIPRMSVRRPAKFPGIVGHTSRARTPGGSHTLVLYYCKKFYRSDLSGMFISSHVQNIAMFSCWKKNCRKSRIL